MDSAALGMLVTAHQQLTALHVQMSVASPQDYVKKVFNMAKMDSYFSIYASEADAMSSMAKA